MAQQLVELRQRNNSLQVVWSGNPSPTSNSRLTCAAQRQPAGRLML